MHWDKQCSPSERGLRGFLRGHILSSLRGRETAGVFATGSNRYVKLTLSLLTGDLTISFPQHQRQCAFLEVLIVTLRSFEAPRVRAASRG